MQVNFFSRKEVIYYIRLAKRRKCVTDRELIRKVHTGNKEALNEIVRMYYDDIYRFCFYLTGHDADSYDITQDVFLRFIKYVDSYTNNNLKGYLLIIARNLCRDYFRKKNDGSAAVLPSEVICTENSIDNVELQFFLKGLLKEIPVEQREVIVLRIHEELKFKDIAKMLGCNISTIKSRFRLGIERLRKEMEGFELE